MYSPLSQITPESPVRDRLLAAALTLFNTKGYASTSVREIVEAAGVTKPVLYYHFRSKEGIYTAVLEEASTQLALVLDDILSRPASATTRLRMLIDECFHLARLHEPAVRLMYAAYYGPQQGAPFFDLRKFHDPIDDSIRRLLGQGIAAGEFRPGCLDWMALAANGLLGSAVETHLCQPELTLEWTTLAPLLDLLLHGLAAPDASAAAASPKGPASPGPALQ